MADFAQDVTKYVMSIVGGSHKDHTIKHPSLHWEHSDGYRYSEYTQEGPSDSVIITGACSCDEKVHFYMDFTGTDLIDFLNQVSADA